MSDVVSAVHEPTGPVGVVIIFLSAIFEFMDIHSGGVVALCAIGGLICTIIGLIRNKRNPKRRKKQ